VELLLNHRLDACRKTSRLDRVPSAAVSELEIMVTELAATSAFFVAVSPNIVSKSLTSLGFYY
jgi:hypothetical protein